MVLRRSVSFKLGVLVASSIVVMMVVLPVLSWLLHHQLVDEVDNRVDEAKAAFQSELDDDLANQGFTAAIMASDTDFRRALEASDAPAARALAQVFATSYPEMDIVLAGNDGRVLTQLGVTAPPEKIDSITELAGVVAGGDFQGVIRHGCERPGSTAPPAYVIAKAVPGAGSVVVCQPFGAAYLEDSASKIGVELAVFAGTGRGEPLVTTPRYPVNAHPTLGEASTLAADAGTTWAFSHISPRGMGGLDVVSALDVGKVKDIVMKNLLYAMAVLLLAAIVSVGIGIRLATSMSRAIHRLKNAQKSLEQQDYVHVESIKTGDELEDLAVTFNGMVDNLKQYDNMKTTMGKYMARKVMRHLLEKKMDMGGEKLFSTILFTDIRGFTSISEHMDAQQLVGLLNEYFTEMVSVVMEHDGVVDKYIGDAIMVVFGPPDPAPDDAIRAVRAAVGMRRALVALNERLVSRGMQALRTGIGIHSGEVVAGSIGHEELRGYTVIGDAVNLASRLETATKELGVPVLISEDTYRLTKDAIVARAVKEIHVKGREQLVMTYELQGLKGEPLLEAPSPSAPAMPGPATTA